MAETLSVTGSLNRSREGDSCPVAHTFPMDRDSAHSSVMSSSATIPPFAAIPVAAQCQRDMQGRKAHPTQIHRTPPPCPDNESFADTFDDGFVRHQQNILLQIQHYKEKGMTSSGGAMHQLTRSSESGCLHADVPLPWSDQKIPAKPSPRDMLARERSSLTQSTAPSSRTSFSSLLSDGGRMNPVERDRDSVRSIRCVAPSTLHERDARVDNKNETKGGALADFLEDAEMIREQARIFEQIQQHRRHEVQQDQLQNRTSLNHSNNNCVVGSTIESDREERRGSTSSFNTADLDQLANMSLRDFAIDATARMDRQTSCYATACTSRRFSESSGPIVETNAGTTTNASARCVSSAPSASMAAVGGGSRTTTYTTMDDIAKKRLSNSSSTSECSSPSVLHRHHQVRDHVVKMGHKNLRVKGTGQTYEAISQGKAVILQCPTCKTILQVSSTAKLLYCGICQSVTPVSLAQGQVVVNPGSASRATSGSSSGLATSVVGALEASSMADADLDVQIARTLQDQELDIACARKLADNYQSTSAGPRRGPRT